MSAPHAALLMLGSGSQDPFFSSVVQLAHFDGTNGSTTFTNSCPRGNTMTIHGGSPSLSTAQFEFGTASLRLATSASLIAASIADYNFSTSAFTIEWWQRLDSVAASPAQVLFDMRPAANGFYPTIYTNGSGDIRYFTNNADVITSSTGVLSATTWQFIALSKVSGTTRLFVGGTQVGSNYTDTNTYLQSRFQYGIGGFDTGPCQGVYFDDLRITNGVGRYSANFTPPIAAFPNG